MTKIIIEIAVFDDVLDELIKSIKDDFKVYCLDNDDIIESFKLESEVV